jgi:hypothetical protein
MPVSRFGIGNSGVTKIREDAQKSNFAGNGWDKFLSQVFYQAPFCDSFVAFCGQKMLLPVLLSFGI